jgi:hypothetical protein
VKRPAAVLAAALMLSTPAWAGASLATGPASGWIRLCDHGRPLDAAQQDRLLQFAGVLRQVLASSGVSAAIVARSGTNLSKVGLRYSHAGISLREPDGDASAWSVRQLFFACDEGRPRIYDQGLAGFVSGTDDPQQVYVSLLLLPDDAAMPLAAATRDRRLALSLQSGDYSANAYPWSARYQNCNQWVMELLATAWGDLAAGPDLRARAQAWLARDGYDPAPLQIRSHWIKLAAGFVPWVRLDDHPDDERYTLQLRTSVPATISAYVRQRLPGTRRVELCHTPTHIVVHEGWTPIEDGCRPGPGDTVIPLAG